MLIASFICFIIAVITAITTYQCKQPTIVLLAKILFHVFLFFFAALLFIAVFNALPPPPKDHNLFPI